MEKNTEMRLKLIMSRTTGVEIKANGPWYYINIFSDYQYPTDFLYQKVKCNGWDLYIATNRYPFVSYLVKDHNHPKNAYFQGFGGRSFPLAMVDGTTEVVEAPWSSRCSVINMFTKNHYMECGWGKENRVCSANVSVSLVALLIQKFAPEFKIVQEKRENGEIAYDIVRKGTTPTPRRG